MVLLEGQKKKYFGQLINIQSGCNSSTACNKIAFSFYPEMFPSSLKLNHFGSKVWAATEPQSVPASIKILSKYDFKLSCGNFLSSEKFWILDWSVSSLCLYVQMSRLTTLSVHNSDYELYQNSATKQQKKLRKFHIKAWVPCCSLESSLIST